eukprot:10055469-Lingulodinium_polyedra.AAC.1
MGHGPCNQLRADLLSTTSTLTTAFAAVGPPPPNHHGRATNCLPTLPLGTVGIQKARAPAGTQTGSNEHTHIRLP